MGHYSLGYQRRQQMRLTKEDRKVRLKYIFDVLDKNKCSEFCLSFSGGGDDGTMDVNGWETTAEDKETQNKIIRQCLDEPVIFEDFTQDQSFYNLLEDAGERFLHDLDVDWVNGMGNSGGIIFDVKNRKVRVTYQIIEDAETEFDESGVINN